jgi:hypothetical protein
VIRLQLFGSPRIRDAERPVSLNRRKSRALLFYLAAHHCRAAEFVPLISLAQSALALAVLFDFVRLRGKAAQTNEINVNFRPAGGEKDVRCRSTAGRSGG